MGESTKGLKVVTLNETNYRQAAATLRVIADQIDKGEYGQVECVALVIDGEQMSVHAMGPSSDVACAHWAFHKAMNYLARTEPVEE